jgi:hypothetical protein
MVAKLDQSGGPIAKAPEERGKQPVTAVATRKEELRPPLVEQRYCNGCAPSIHGCSEKPNQKKTKNDDGPSLPVGADISGLDWSTD